MKQQHARVITTAFAAGGLVALGTAGAIADPGGGNDNAAEHQMICHALGTPDDAGNGYNMISPSKTGVARGHANWDFKAGQLPAEGMDEGHLADIIPPFTYMDPTTKEEVDFPGQNWDDEGQAIYDNDCVVPDEEPTEPTEPTEEPTEPTEEPTEPTEPTEEPTEPTDEPTEEPTEPTDEPTEPTEEPTEPTDEPTEPTDEPTDDDEVVVPPAGEDDTTPPAAGDAGQPETPVVVQTDGTGASDNSMLAALGVAMLFAGGATAVAIGAGVSGRRH